MGGGGGGWNLCISTLKNIITIFPQSLYEDQGRSRHFTLSTCDVVFFTSDGIQAALSQFMFYQEHSVHHHTQSNSVVHPVFYPMATGGSFCGLQHPEDEVHIFKPNTTVGNATKNFITLSEDPTDEQVIKVAG